MREDDRTEASARHLSARAVVYRATLPALLALSSPIGGLYAPCFGSSPPPLLFVLYGARLLTTVVYQWHVLQVREAPSPGAVTGVIAPWYRWPEQRDLGGAHRCEPLAQLWLALRQLMRTSKIERLAIFRLEGGGGPYCACSQLA